MKKSVKFITVLTLVACTLYLCACNNKDTDKNEVQEPTNTPDLNQNDLEPTQTPLNENKDSAQVTFDFSKGSADANHEFSDYLKDNEDNYDLKGGVEKIGESDKRGYKLSANNQGDDLFMYVIMPVMLKSDRDYSVKGSFNLCSIAQSDIADADESKNSLFTVKAGVVGNVPNKQSDESDYFRIDIDKGNGSSDGADLLNVESAEKGIETTETGFVTKSYDFESDVITNVNGNAYIIVGVQCGDNAKTTVYLENLTANFEEK